MVLVYRLERSSLSAQNLHCPSLTLRTCILCLLMFTLTAGSLCIYCPCFFFPSFFAGFCHRYLLLSPVTWILHRFTHTHKRARTHTRTHTDMHMAYKRLMTIDFWFVSNWCIGHDKGICQWVGGINRNHPSLRSRSVKRMFLNLATRRGQ